MIATKQADGKVKLNQLFHPTGAGAAIGTLWGALIGMIFLMPLAGAAIGAASGALSGALTDVGINDGFMKEVSSTLDSGSAALFLLIRKMTTDKVLEDLKGIRTRARVKGPEQRARHSNWAFSQLRQFISYKAQRVGIPICLIDPKHTSQRCSRCGQPCAAG